MLLLWGTIACLLTVLLAALARSQGWGDEAKEGTRLRKHQRAAVPVVGGVAIALVWAAQAYAGEVSFGAGEGLLLASGLVALASGLWDDLRARGLGPWAQLGFHVLIAFLLGIHGGAGFADTFGGGDAVSESRELAALFESMDWLGFLRAFVVAMLVLNAIAVFDNADGAVGGLAALGLGFTFSPAAGAVLGFLVPNLWLRRDPPPVSPAPNSLQGGQLGSNPSRGWSLRDPMAYLGNGGSQLLAVALLAVPGAHFVAFLPLLDLVRVAHLRWRLGFKPWQGDRRHLAHRLQRLGLGPTAVALALAAIASPTLLLPPAFGPSLTLGLFLATLQFTRKSEAKVGPDAPHG